MYTEKTIRWSACLLAAAVALTTTSSAAAFCGFYISGAEGSLVNNATMVSMMREGTRTVLAMQNNYEGPASDFALVIPVPEILSEEKVRTLPRETFDRLDAMAAPRLVEYWEQDPCFRPERRERMMARGGATAMAPEPTLDAEEADYGVEIEAEFAVGEYEVVVLSAREATGLERWLNDNEYQIPDGAAPYLRPYIESGMYFFVAKVNAELVTFSDDGRTMLSPLRFHYDSEAFDLPIRLGLINADGPQDLIVHILAPNQRYEAANYTNVTIPTNLDVTDRTRDNFGEFYAALFDRTLERNENAVVTEYSWAASTCDPCPGVTLQSSDFTLLGADVLPSTEDAAYSMNWQLRTNFAQVTAAGEVNPKYIERDARSAEQSWLVCHRIHGGEELGDLDSELQFSVGADGSLSGVTVSGGGSEDFRDCVADSMSRVHFTRPTGGNATATLRFGISGQRQYRGRGNPGRELVLTRLHMRYSPDALGEDLVFRAAPPIEGGRENRRGGVLEEGATPSSVNNFQGRYAIRHLWEGPIECENPRRGVWGGPPNGRQPPVAAARDLAFAQRGRTALASFLAEDVPELGIEVE